MRRLKDSSLNSSSALYAEGIKITDCVYRCSGGLQYQLKVQMHPRGLSRYPDAPHRQASGLPPWEWVPEQRNHVSCRRNAYVMLFFPRESDPTLPHSIFSVLFRYAT